MGVRLDQDPRAFAREVEHRSGEDPARCYQCGKCSAGCPMEDYMDVPPHRVIRMVQLGCRSEALSSGAIWLCASCFACTTRCPQEFDLARAMDAMRQMALAEGRKPPEGKVIAFHRAFLRQIRTHGRLFELGLIGEYKLRTGALFQDLEVAPPMLRRGKLKFFPKRIQGTDEVSRIFERAEAAAAAAGIPRAPG